MRSRWANFPMETVEQHQRAFSQQEAGGPEHRVVEDDVNAAYLEGVGPKIARRKQTPPMTRKLRMTPGASMP